MLAFACAFTMFAGAASFTDEADISENNRDAVELLTTLNVIQGDPDGSFAPEREVTRAEMAKMIYVIRNGGNDNADAYETVATSFTDISGHWAEGYIKYLQNTGIVAGKSATKFDPDSTVTTGEAMKMALVLAGYRADKAGLTGTQWLNNTVSYATTYGLTKNVNSAIAGGCTRQDAAQILSNVLTEVNAVQWSEVTNSFLNDSERGLAWGGDPITVGEKWMDLAIETGFITAAPNAKVNPKGITLKIDANGNGRYGSDDGESINFRNATIDVSDLFGYEVKVVWNSDKQTDADAIYGIYKTDNNTSYETNWASVEADGAKVKFGGKSYSLTSMPIDGDSTANQVTVYADKVAAEDHDSEFFTNEDLADTIVFIDNNDDGKIDAAQIKTQDVAKVTYVGNSKLNTTDLVATGSDYTPFDPYDTNPDLSDVIVYDGIAKDDYVKVSYNYYNDKVTYEKIDAVEATVGGTRTNTAGTQEIRIDGTWYTAAEGYKLPSLVSGDTIEYVAIGTLLYNVKKTDGIWGSKSLTVVYDVAQYGVGARANDLEISYITRDGEKQTAILDEYNGNTINPTYNGGGGAFDGYDTDGDGTANWGNAAAAKSALVSQLMTYRLSGNEIDLMPVSTTQPAGYDDVYSISTGATSNVATGYNRYDQLVNTSGNTISISDNAVVFVVEGGTMATVSDVDVLTGSEAKKAFDGITANSPTEIAAVAAGGEENGVNYIQAFVARVPNLDNVTVVGSNYAYVINANETVNADDYREFNLWTVNGEMTVYEKTSDFYEYEGGEIISYDVVSTANDQIVIDNVARENVTLGTVTSSGLYGTNSNKVAINSAEFELDADCEIINVNTEDKEGIEGDAASAVRVGVTGTANIAYITIDGDIVFILVDGENDTLKVANTSVSATGLTNAQLAYLTKSASTVTVNGNVTSALDLSGVTGTIVFNGDVTAALTTDGAIELRFTQSINASTAIPTTSMAEGTRVVFQAAPSDIEETDGSDGSFYRADRTTHAAAANQVLTNTVYTMTADVNTADWAWVAAN